MKRKSLLLALAAVICTTPVSGGVYKYQDEHGKWHFTDKPPENKGSTAVTTSTSGQTSRANLQEDLTEKFKPASKVDEASLAVVTVKTAGGSGFRDSLLPMTVTSSLIDMLSDPRPRLMRRMWKSNSRCARRNSTTTSLI